MCFQLKELILTVYAAGENGIADERDCATDVIALIEEPDASGRPVVVKYVASFFTYNHIATLLARHKASGEFLSGTYLHAPNMVLIDRCTEARVRSVLEDLIGEGEFKRVFRKLT